MWKSVQSVDNKSSVTKIPELGFAATQKAQKHTESAPRMVKNGFDSSSPKRKSRFFFLGILPGKEL